MGVFKRPVLVATLAAGQRAHRTGCISGATQVRERVRPAIGQPTDRRVRFGRVDPSRAQGVIADVRHGVVRRRSTGVTESANNRRHFGRIRRSGKRVRVHHQVGGGDDLHREVHGSIDWTHLNEPDSRQQGCD